MRTVWIIGLREFKRYFSTPAAYLIAFFFLLIMGFIFYVNLWFAVQSQFPPGISDILGPLVFLLLFATPGITMHLLADEQRMGTIELLLTAPVRDWELVIGKWLGGFMFMLTLVAVTLIYPLILNQLVEPGIDQGPLITGYLGLILICAALVAVGVTVSSLFSNQVAAFFLTLVIFLLLWIISAPAQASPGGGELLNYLDFRQHYTATFQQGVIDARDLIYYLSLTALSLFFGSVIVEARRWR